MTQPAPLRVADSIAATLAAHGLTAAFGMPGGEVVTLLDALTRAGIGFHLARHETAAAMMAAGHATLSRTPGLLVTTVGPGLANAVNGIADAAQEHVPLIVISGVVDRASRSRYTHQVIDHTALLAPLVKASFEVAPQGAAATVARAIRLALTAPMGPVHLDLSPEIAALPAPDPEPALPTPVSRPGLAADDPALRELADRIAKAHRPLVLAGFEAARHPQSADIRTLLNRLQLPVITTYKAKGLVDETVAFALGAAGLSPRADAELLALVAQADLVLTLGYDPIEMRAGWMDSLGDPSRLIEISAAPADHAMYRAGQLVQADLAAFARALLPLVRPHATWPGAEPSATRSRLQAIFATPAPWGPHAIVEMLNTHLPPDAVVTVDSGAHRILLSQKWQAQMPLRLLQSAGFCTMAAALPLAVGAAVAAPSRRVVAVMGDGGLEMGIGELATLRDLALPVTVVVFQDQSLALIAQKQAAAGLAACGVALGQTDFVQIAQGFGGHGVLVEDSAALALALRQAARRDHFSLIACRFSADAYDGAF